MKLVKFSTLILLVSFASNSLIAQEQTETINDGSINDKFEFVLRKSGNFKGTNGASYEAVRRSMFLSLQAQTNDSINTLKETLANTNTVVANHS